MIPGFLVWSLAFFSAFFSSAWAGDSCVWDQVYKADAVEVIQPGEALVFTDGQLLVQCGHGHLRHHFDVSERIRLNPGQCVSVDMDEYKNTQRVKVLFVCARLNP